MLKRVLAYDQKVQNGRYDNLYRSDLETRSSTLNTEYSNGLEEISKNSSEQIELSTLRKSIRIRFENLIDYRAAFVVTACGLYVWQTKELSSVYDSRISSLQRNNRSFRNAQATRISKLWQNLTKTMAKSNRKLVCLPDMPVMSILGRFLALRTTTVSLAAAGWWHTDTSNSPRPWSFN